MYDRREMFLTNDLFLKCNIFSDFEGFNVAVIFSNLKKLNVSKNKIANIKGLVPFRGLTIKEFVLEFNPICHNYLDRKEYITSIKLIFPTVKILVSRFLQLGYVFFHIYNVFEFSGP